MDHSESIATRVMAFAAMGYLATIFFAQDESNEPCLSVLEKMAEALIDDHDVARELTPYLTTVAQMMGYEIQTVVTDEALH